MCLCAVSVLAPCDSKEYSWSDVLDKFYCQNSIQSQSFDNLISESEPNQCLCMGMFRAESHRKIKHKWSGIFVQNEYHLYSCQMSETLAKNTTKIRPTKLSLKTKCPLCRSTNNTIYQSSAELNTSIDENYLPFSLFFNSCTNKIK